MRCTQKKMEKKEYKNEYLGCHYEDYIESMISFDDIEEFSVSDKDKYYHYASVDAVKSILQHKDQVYTMWASHLSFLNDWEEFENGRELIFCVLEKFIKNNLGENNNPENVLFQQTVEKFLREARFADKDICIDGEIIFSRNIFVLCFCQEENSLNQWKYYGKESGIALEFNLGECEYLGIICGEPESYVTQKPYKVIYDDITKKKVLERLVNKMYQEFLENQEDKQRALLHSLADMYGLCPLFKHRDFKDEQECRLLFRPVYNDNQHDVRELVKYRKRDGILLPYMEVGLHVNKKSDNSQPLIKNIIIGPGENQQLLYQSIRHFALYTGVFDDYNESEGKIDVQKMIDEHILKSETPFRG